MTGAYADPRGDLTAPVGVYAPQHDSELLTGVLMRTGLARGSRVADLCTGSGVAAITAANDGAVDVLAFDVSPQAVRCARANALSAGVDVDVHLGSWSRAAEFGPFDLVLCNPPYVPEPPDGDTEVIPIHAGPATAFNAGVDGRLVLDPLCAAAPDLLDEDGTMLIVHSEFSDVDASLAILRQTGLKASVIARQWIPFGPVLTARADWLQRVGKLEQGRRIEELVVIRADVP
ncbi:HemK2/MTQ2 family protein methyltransferase [Mycobacterium sp. URHB0044]|uniref:HemK2/MTQ2 family protein methyltransferase n=1 Tax=Mycobacterium sp. URHB0044 TaxID=1380386 RepID=UPI00048C5FFA|nr:HemK2/MTQ2 family protein methyltransferase [Mycobacterium sp. URHB0044]